MCSSARTLVSMLFSLSSSWHGCVCQPAYVKLGLQRADDILWSGLFKVRLHHRFDEAGQFTFGEAQFPARPDGQQVVAARGYLTTDPGFRFDTFDFHDSHDPLGLTLAGRLRGTGQLVQHVAAESFGTLGHERTAGHPGLGLQAHKCSAGLKLPQTCPRGVGQGLPGCGVHVVIVHRSFSFSRRDGSFHSSCRAADAGLRRHVLQPDEI
jgi:hypothetical protein